jgi:hypothetical protein
VDGSVVWCGDWGTKKVAVTHRGCEQVAIPSSKGAYWGEVGLGLGLGVQSGWAVGWGMAVGVRELGKWW